jgi:hypothetical protein
MSLDQKEVYDVVACAHRTGALEKLLSVQGEAIEAALEEGKMTMWELLNAIEEVGEETIAKVDGLLGMIGGFMKFGNNDELMMLLSYLLDDNFLRGMIIQRMKDSILQAASEPRAS